jgi:hypothetical protein
VRHYFDANGHVNGIEVFDDDVVADALMVVTKLDRVRSISLTTRRLGEREFRLLASIENLDYLWAPDADMGDEFASQLARNKQLKSLDLGGQDLTAAGLAQFANISTLEKLSVGRLSVMVPELGSLENLSELSLSFSEPGVFTDADLACVCQLTKLRRLSLASTDITDDGLAALASLKNLERLSLDGCKITDAGLLRLVKMLPKLKSIGVAETQVTADGVEEFKSLRPGCGVRRN